MSISVVSRGTFQEAAEHHLVYGLHPSPFGTVLVVLLDQVLCGLMFQGPLPLPYFLTQAENQLRVSLHRLDSEKTQHWIQSTLTSAQTIPLVMAGTAFQLKVWHALPQILHGTTRTYQQFAEILNAPRAMRSLGQALKANPLSYLLPCHRVVSSSGKLGSYRWGSGLKRSLLEHEGVVIDAPTHLQPPGSASEFTSPVLKIVHA